MKNSFMHLVRHDGLVLGPRAPLMAIPTDRTLVPVAESPEFKAFQELQAGGSLPPELQAGAEKAVEAVTGDRPAPAAKRIDYLSITKGFCA